MQVEIIRTIANITTLFPFWKDVLEKAQNAKYTKITYRDTFQGNSTVPYGTKESHSLVIDGILWSEGFIR